MSISTFEHLEAQLNLHNTSYRVIVVYRPPPSVKNGYTEEQFMDEFSDKLINCTTAHQNLLVMGDFNIHMDKPDSPDWIGYYKNLIYLLNLQFYCVNTSYPMDNC